MESAPMEPWKQERSWLEKNTMEWMKRRKLGPLKCTEHKLETRFPVLQRPVELAWSPLCRSHCPEL